MRTPRRGTNTGSSERLPLSPPAPIPLLFRCRPPRLRLAYFTLACSVLCCWSCFGPRFGRPKDPRPAFDCAVAPSAPEIEEPDEISPRARAIQRRIERSIYVQARRGHFTRFAAAVVVGDRIAYSHLFNTSERRPFWVGSISKTFTALSVLRLVEEGLVRLDDPIGRHLPGLKIADPRLGSPPVEIQDLLAHTSGLPDIRFYQPTAYREYQGVKYPEQIYPAGLHYRYSNHGFMILGRLVEKTTRLPFGEFLHRHVYAPLCMRQARTHPRINGASGVAVSLRDLAAYASFWLRGARTPTGRALLSDELMERMLQPRSLIPFGEKRRFAGLGWRVNRDDDTVATFFHIGGAPRVAGWVQMFPEANAAVLYLGNPPEYNPGFEWFLTKTQRRLGELATLLAAAERPVHVFRASRPTSALMANYAGSYRNPLSGERVRVYHRNGSIYVKRGWHPRYKMYPFTAHVFKGGPDYTHFDFVYRDADQPHPTALATPAGYFKRETPVAAEKE